MPFGEIVVATYAGPLQTLALGAANPLGSMVPVSIRLILETDKEKNARSVLARLEKIVEFDLRDLAPYSKGGFEANVTIGLSDGTWPEIVHRVIALAQSFSSGWGLGGSIDDEIELVAEDGFRIPGIRFAWIVCIRAQTPSGS